MKKLLYYEDLNEGLQFVNGGYTIDKAHAIAFAKEYDPQFFHIDEEAARHSVFGKLAVSGMHTAAIAMRLKVLSPFSQVAGGLVGLGMGSLKWPRPVYPGDTLRLVVTITGRRPSNSKPSQGLVTYKMELFNQHDALVMEAQPTILAPYRPI